MSIYARLQTPIQDREEVVEYEGERFIIRGRPNASIYGRSMLLGDEEKAVKSRHWATFNGCEIDADFVPKVMLVREYLVKSEEDGGSPEGTDRYDETDIAKLAAEHGPLFISLYNASARVSGLAESKKREGDKDGKEDGKDGEEHGADGIETAALGESNASAN